MELVVDGQRPYSPDDEREFIFESLNKAVLFEGYNVFEIEAGKHELDFHYIFNFERTTLFASCGEEIFVKEGEELILTVNVCRWRGFADVIEGDAEYDVEKERNANKGCYVATCVYGSYDRPPVWTLRRYRDNKLAGTWYGRLFIKIYYATSPILVKWFGNKKWFKEFCLKKLNGFVEKLQKQGYDGKPYDD